MESDGAHRVSEGGWVETATTMGCTQPDSEWKQELPCLGCGSGSCRGRVGLRVAGVCRSARGGADGDSGLCDVVSRCGGSEAQGAVKRHFRIAIGLGVRNTTNSTTVCQ